MSLRITRGAGIAIPNTQDEVFNFGKDWIVWNFRDNDGHWFSGKREAMRFIKLMNEANKKHGNGTQY